jgi:acetyl esterase/lipase
MKFFFLLTLAAIISLKAPAQTIIDLYGNGPVLNSKPCSEKETAVKTSNGRGGVSNVIRPTLQVFIPQNRNSTGASVIICPGGGYARLAIEHEGFEVAQALNDMGITAFVLKNRLPSSACMEQKEIGPLMDVQQAVKLVRENASTYKIDTGKIGVMGFSAGGHLASSAGTHFNDAVIPNPKKTSLRPDFLVLLYPVISMRDSLTHKGSKDNLIGPNPTEALVKKFSNEEQVTPQTPPTFLVHAADDRTVPVNNSILFFQALLKNKVPAEMHIYQNGGHGFGLHNATTKDEWIERLKNWFLKNGFLK